ncbi:hypothetical protein R1CP_21005 [Rhodococcus opacus]|uniref:Transcription regulator AsnC/Lrp ligand binding domain-containing protein n=1 Tax=Rhodococcus opacus TaxID=37919 RepID=A0A1B1K8H9_RHOOP|nr:hypothetical protein R1CP_21005 [Rhodococcus opacus]
MLALDCVPADDFGFTLGLRDAVGGTSAFIALSIRQDSWRAVSDELRTTEFVDHFSLLGGDFDVLVLVRAPDNETLRRVVLEGLQSLDGVRSTVAVTQVALSSLHRLCSSARSPPASCRHRTG